MKLNPGFFLFFIALLGVSAQAAENSVTVDKAGDFSLMPYYLQGSSRLTNEDGQLGKFNASGYGVRMGLRPFSSWLKGFSFIVDVSNSKAENDFLSVETYNATGLQYGFAQYLASSLYITGTLGSQKIEAKNVGVESEFDVKTVGIGLGFDLFNIEDTFAISVEVQHHKGYAQKPTSNGIGSYNAGYDSTAFFIGARWSPSVSVSFKSR